MSNVKRGSVNNMQALSEQVSSEYFAFETPSLPSEGEYNSNDYVEVHPQGGGDSGYTEFFPNDKTLLLKFPIYYDMSDNHLLLRAQAYYYDEQSSDVSPVPITDINASGAFVCCGIHFDYEAGESYGSKNALLMPALKTDNAHQENETVTLFVGIRWASESFGNASGSNFVRVYGGSVYDSLGPVSLAQFVIDDVVAPNIFGVLAAPGGKAPSAPFTFEDDSSNTHRFCGLLDGFCIDTNYVSST
jgi:hypothetical protein